MQAYQRRQKIRLARMRAAIYAEAMRQLDAVRPRFTTWIAPNPGAHSRAGYFAARGCRFQSAAVLTDGWRHDHHDSRLRGEPRHYPMLVWNPLGDP